MAEQREPKTPVPASKMAAAASSAGGPSLRASPPRTGAEREKPKVAAGAGPAPGAGGAAGAGPAGSPHTGPGQAGRPPPGQAGPGRAGGAPPVPPPVPRSRPCRGWRRRPTWRCGCRRWRCWTRCTAGTRRGPARCRYCPGPPPASATLCAWCCCCCPCAPWSGSTCTCSRRCCSARGTRRPAQVCVCTLCTLLLRPRQAWLFSAPLLPVLARLCGVPLRLLPLANTLAAACSGAELLYLLGSHLLGPFQLAAAACRELMQAMEVYRVLALGVSLWGQLGVPLLFLVFWLVLFSLRLSAFLASSGSAVAQQGLLFVLLSSVAECCSTPYSLVGLTFTVSYLALGVLNLCKFYLLGFGAFHNGNVMHRGVTEGVTLLLLALQTGLLDLQVLQRTFLLSIILFIVVTSTLQSMIEIADPIVLALGASRNSLWKHFRGVSMCLFLLVFPCFMAYKIAHFFHLDFWLLILVSSCMLTSLQVLGTLFIYGLFVVELLQATPLERMDEIIYGVTAVSRVLEFLVALCVVAYGSWESLVGEWSWVGVSVIVLHSYCNVWLRARAGWRSFLLRRQAAQKISSLPRATRAQLRDHDDVCAICFQDMQVAVVTPCGHFFHGACLRKWLYVQDTCPMCHQGVAPPAPQDDAGSGMGTQEGAAPEDEGLEDAGPPARPQEDEPPPGDSVPTGPGDSGAGACSPERGEEAAGAPPQPPRVPPSTDSQQLLPPPASPDPTVGDSGDSHSGHQPS
ncbi:RING finger protein 145-like isoform X2 [Anas acuta]|uniref:RING finger protein 145-like isoform X2 n=1 Tax=Anas acuta TaxID=28680 RepID=UPI0035C93254